MHPSIDLFKEIIPSLFNKKNTVIDQCDVDIASGLYPARAVNTILSRSAQTIELAQALSTLKHLPACASYEVARAFAPSRRPKFTFKEKGIEKTRVDEIVAILGVDQPTAQLYDSVISDEEFEELKSRSYTGGLK